jgi:hypothetical protein
MRFPQEMTEQYSHSDERGILLGKQMMQLREQNNAIFADYTASGNT